MELRLENLQNRNETRFYSMMAMRAEYEWKFDNIISTVLNETDFRSQRIVYTVGIHSYRPDIKKVCYVQHRIDISYDTQYSYGEGSIAHLDNYFIFLVYVSVYLLVSLSAFHHVSCSSTH